MRLSIGLAGWQVHQLVREAMGCATTGAKQVRHRGFDKCICAVALCGKGLLVKALDFWFFLSRKPTERSSLRPMDTNNTSIKNEAQPARRR